MSKSPESKRSYAVRREMRLRRDKAAMAVFAARVAQLKGDLSLERLKTCAEMAVEASDCLLAELDRTRQPEFVEQGDVEEKVPDA